jgi:formiminotetrahydrofolate cyclodeaminase
MNYANQSVDRFLAAVASESVTPAGGTVAAVAGAAGASLCELVCIHTDDARAELGGVREDLREDRRRLLELADADADAVEALLRAQSEGGGDTETKRATGVPLAIAEGCLAVLERAPAVVGSGNPNAVPDAVTGAFLAHAALRASVFTVRSNLRHVDDGAFVEETAGRAADVERDAERAFGRVMELVDDPRPPADSDGGT